MMPKGLCAMLFVAALFAVPPSLSAQVYRCETESGVEYSDMPCGEGAQEIKVTGDVVNSRGVGAPGSPRAQEHADPPPAVNMRALEDTGQNLNEFLAILRAQREEQIGLIDNQIDQLRAQAGSTGFADMEAAEQEAINSQIASLESNKASILAEYEALIAEAERRLD